MDPRQARAAVVALLALAVLMGCTSATNPRRAETSSRDVQDSGASPSPSYAAAPAEVRTEEGLVLPVPSGWFARDLTENAVGSSWDLRAADPAGDPGAISITIRTADATEGDQEEVSRCPEAIEEARIDSCDFIEFNGQRWRRILGESDVRFVDYAAVSGSKLFRLIGFPADEDDDSLARIEALLVKAEIA